MSKKFRLPKAFATKWLEALRSGEYEQTNGTLCSIDSEDGTKSYCCLGVAGVISDVDTDNLENRLVLSDLHKDSVPAEIIGDAATNYFVKVVVKLNDGVKIEDMSKYEENGVVFRDEDFESDNNEIKMNFKEIADVIEDNTEFYE